jgi:hypothetical protein
VAIKRVGPISGLLLSLVACGLTASAGPNDSGLSPTPENIAARLPTYCRYDIDVREDPAAHEKLLKATDEDSVTCPFVDQSNEGVKVYKLRQNRACSSQDLAGLKVVGVREISGREKRIEQKCSPLSIGDHPSPAQLGGKQYLVVQPSDSIVGDITQTSTISRTGAPIVQEGGGTSSKTDPRGVWSATSYSCSLCCRARTSIR